MTGECQRTGSEKYWEVAEHPGYLGSRKDAAVARWNDLYGEGNWALVWEMPVNDEIWTFDDVFWRVYVPGYTEYFRQHPDEAWFLTQSYAYAFDRDAITREQAFDYRALYEQQGRPNQFHHVALNIALEYFLGMPFQGVRPIQVRGPETEGGRWNPGRIPAVRQDLIMPGDRFVGWWEEGSVEQVYQECKALYVRQQH